MSLWVPRQGLISVRGPDDEDKTDCFNFGTPSHLGPSFGYPISLVAWLTSGSGTSDTAQVLSKDTSAEWRILFHSTANWGSIAWDDTGGGTRAMAIASAANIGLVTDDLTPNFLAYRLPDSSGAVGDCQLWGGQLWRPPTLCTTYTNRQVPGSGTHVDHSSIVLAAMGPTSQINAWMYATKGRVWVVALYRRYLSDGELFALWKNLRPDTVPDCYFFGVPTFGGMHDYSDFHLSAPSAQALGTTGMRWGDENAMGKAVWDRVLTRRRTYSFPRTVVTQTRFRFRNDDGTEVTATWAEAEGADETIAPGGVRRLRLQVKADGDEASSSYKIQVRKQGTTPYKDVTVE